jgi:hypothetical protein
MVKLIGIAGRKFSGKDTAANILVEEAGFVNVKFAFGIKTLATAFFKFIGFPEDVIHEVVDGSRKEESFAILVDEGTALFAQFVQVEHDLLSTILGIDLRAIDFPPFTGTTSREFQQFIGTEIGRNLAGETVWTDAAMAEAEKHERVVISDVRFPNELDIIHDRGGIVARLQRDQAKGGQFIDHPSENQIDTLDADLVILNNFTLNDLYHAMLYVVGPSGAGVKDGATPPDLLDIIVRKDN